MTMADAMVTFGLKDAGYTYLSIDDCWLMKNRSADGQLVADPDRFPSGIKALADYMHERGLKLGMPGLSWTVLPFVLTIFVFVNHEN